MQIINNNWWINAQVSEDANIRYYPYLAPSFCGGIWYDGEWKDGDWMPVIGWENDMWSCGVWINGIWHKHGDHSINFFGKNISKVSPKTYKKPHKTLSLNYANYK